MKQKGSHDLLNQHTERDQNCALMDITGHKLLGNPKQRTWYSIALTSQMHVHDVHPHQRTLLEDPRYRIWGQHHPTSREQVVEVQLSMDHSLGTPDMQSWVQHRRSISGLGLPRPLLSLGTLPYITSFKSHYTSLRKALSLLIPYS